jgi:hypothetical protein
MSEYTFVPYVDAHSQQLEITHIGGSSLPSAHTQILEVFRLTAFVPIPYGNLPMAPITIHKYREPFENPLWPEVQGPK